MTLIEEIRDKVGEAELLAQLAEEAAEFSQAALKLRRKLDGRNPTPKTERELRANLDEELADVAVCVSALGLDTKWELMRKKICRWVERLEENAGSGENAGTDWQRLKSCPVCKRHSARLEVDMEGVPTFYVVCTECGYKTDKFYVLKNAEHAWNGRG